MSHSLGDGIRAADQAMEDSRRRAVDFIETHDLRDPEKRGVVRHAIAILYALEARTIAEQTSKTADYWLKNCILGLWHHAEMELNRE